MILSEKETTVIKDLQTQEQCCVEKYERYSKLAKDQVLIDLFTDLHGKEQKHLESLTQVLSGGRAVRSEITPSVTAYAVPPPSAREALAVR